jgi:hypothetical protein
VPEDESQAESDRDAENESDRDAEHESERDAEQESNRPVEPEPERDEGAESEPAPQNESLSEKSGAEQVIEDEVVDEVSNIPTIVYSVLIVFIANCCSAKSRKKSTYISSYLNKISNKNI